MAKFRMGGEVVDLKFSTYTNGTLAAMAYDEDGYTYAVLSKNLVDETPTNEYCVFIDENNLGEYNVIDTLINKGYGKPTGAMGLSGFCIYPEFEFNKDIVTNNQLVEEGLFC